MRAIKNVARTQGVRATFMSQPINNLFGSGCHIHQSLLSEDSGRNVFFARTEVFDAAGTLIAFGASTHRYRAGSGDPMGVPVEG